MEIFNNFSRKTKIIVEIARDGKYIGEGGGL